MAGLFTEVFLLGIFIVNSRGTVGCQACGGSLHTHKGMPVIFHGHG